MIFAVVGPSGAGKDTLISGALRQRPDLRVVRRVITRPSGAGGEDFEGVSEAAFRERMAAGEFALAWSAHGHRYGIPWAPLRGPGDVIFNGSREALPSAIATLPDLRIILVTAEEALLAARLAMRRREDATDIQERLRRAEYALPPGVTATTVVNDGTPEKGVARFLAALASGKANPPGSAPAGRLPEAPSLPRRRGTSGDTPDPGQTK